MSFNFYEIGSYWRPYELESAKKYFGEITKDFKKTDLLICRNNTECMSSNTLSQAINLEKIFLHENKNGKIINPSLKYKYSNNKDECFSKWDLHKIPHPKCRIINHRKDLENIHFPYLLRLNDGVTGEDTFLIESISDIDNAWLKLEKSLAEKSRINTKIISVDFIDTKTADGFNISYRIIVSGKKVVCGYARISDDWLAITKQFTEDKKEAFIRENKKLAKIIDKNRDTLVKAVEVVGHHHVGIDAIPDQSGNLHLLEIQPFYFCGDTRRTSGPFWNPYKPKILVDWLINDKNNLEKEIPEYYNRWLDKKAHFDFCYKSLKESLLDVRSE